MMLTLKWFIAVNNKMFISEKKTNKKNMLVFFIIILYITINVQNYKVFVIGLSTLDMQIKTEQLCK